MKRQFKKISMLLVIICLSLTTIGGGKARGNTDILANTFQESQLFNAQITTETVELLGQIGGVAQTVQVRGSYAYAGFGTELDILDISNPAQIQRVGWLAAEGDVLDISLNGDFAYLAYRGKLSGKFGPTGLQVVDISHPGVPVSIATLQFESCGYSPRVIASESDAFFSFTACEAFGGIIQNAGAYLYRLNISNPAKPMIVAESNIMMGEVFGIAFNNSQVYAVVYTDYDPGGTPPGVNLIVFDVSTHSALIATGATHVSQPASGIDLAGNYAFLAAGTAGLQVIDVSDPGNPVPAITFTLPSAAQTIFIDGSTAYVGTDTAKILLVDISDPLNPLMTGAYSTSGQPLDIEIAGTTGYSGNGASGLEVFGTATLSQQGIFLYPHIINEIAYSNPFAYLAAEYGYWVMDLTNPRMPVLQAHLNTPQPAVSVVLTGVYAYVASPNDGLKIIDISNPGMPYEAGAYALPIDLRQLTQDGNTLYAAAGTAGLRILDINNPLAPQEIGSYTPPYGINRVAAAGRYVYLAADNGNLVILDVSDPSAPEEMGVYNPPEQLYSWQETSAIAVQNNTVFLATIEPPPTPLAGFFSGDVWLIDVSRPKEPSLIYHIAKDFGWAPEGFSLGANRLHVAYERQGLHTYDITDLAAPLEIDSFDPPEYLSGVTSTGEVEISFNDNIYITRSIDPNLPSINGWITHPNHQPKPGVLVSAGDPLSENISDLQGAFSLRNLSGGTYTIVPSLSGFVFSPSSRTVDVSPSAFSQNFTILAQPVSALFEPGVGLTLSYTDTQDLPTLLDVPPDASNTPINLSLVPSVAESAPGYAFTGHAFEFIVEAEPAHAPDYAFNALLTLTIHYSPDDVAVISDTYSLTLWWWNGAAWQDATDSCTPASEYSVDTENRIISVPICQSGTFKLMGPTHQVNLPIIMR